MKFVGPKMFVSGDSLEAAENSVIIINHRSTVDWYYVASVMIQAQYPFNKRNCVNYNVVDFFKHLPFVGLRNF